MVKVLPTIERSTKIKFGKYASESQGENSIVLNASEQVVDAIQPGVYMTPIRVNADIGTTILGYNPNTKEILNTNVSTNAISGFSSNLEAVSAVGNIITLSSPFFANVTTAFTTISGSNVGIGTSSPAYNLDVAGTSNFTDTLYLTGSAGTPGQVLTSSGGGAPTWTTVSSGSSSPWLTLNSNVYYNSGNVGIGTTTPAYKLHVAGDINFTGALRANGSTGTSGQVLTSSGSGAPTWTTVSGGSSVWLTGTNNTAYYNLGYVGIGTTSPAYNLDVAGDINFTGTLYQNGSVFSGGGSSPWTTSGSDIYYNSGNVGIGTTTPTSKLYVSGDGYFTSSVNASSFSGDGSGITSLNSSNVTSGTLAVSYGGTGVTSSTGSGSVVLNTDPNISGTITAGTFSGSGSALTSLNSSNVTSGTLAVSYGGTGVTSSTGSGSVVLNTDPNISGTITAGTFSGSGSALTSLNSSNVTSGTLAVSYGGTGVTSSTGSGSVVLNTDPNISGTITAGTFSGSGSALTSLNSSNVTSGTLAVSYGGTGQSTYATGDLIYASGTNTLSKLSPGTSGQVLTSSGTGSAPTWTTVWTASGSDIYYNSGNVGIQNTYAIHTLDVGSNLFVDDIGSDILNVTGNVNATNYLKSKRLEVSEDATISGNVTITSNTTSQNITLTNTDITASITSNTITIDAKGKTYGTALPVFSTSDVSNLVFSNLISGAQIVIPIVSSGNTISISSTMSNVDFHAMTSDVLVTQNNHVLMTLSNLYGNIYMNAIEFS